MENKNNAGTTEERVTQNVYRCEDGVYRWYYEFQMLKNPTILFTVWKVLLFSSGVVWLLVGMPALFGNGVRDFLQVTGVFAILFLVFLGIGGLAYLILAAAYHGTYMVLFEMTETEIRHIQVPRQFKKAEAIGWLTSFLGSLSGNLGRTGQGLLIATKDTSTSVFANVETVKVRRKRHTIHVNQLLSRNQVYAEEADFDFVTQFILARCTNARVKVKVN